MTRASNYQTLHCYGAIILVPFIWLIIMFFILAKNILRSTITMFMNVWPFVFFIFVMSQLFYSFLIFLPNYLVNLYFLILIRTKVALVSWHNLWWRINTNSPLMATNTNLGYIPNKDLQHEESLQIATTSLVEDPPKHILLKHCDG